MLSTASNNFDVKPNSIDLRQNFTENFVSLKNDNGLPIMNDNHSFNKIMNTLSQSSKQIKNPNVMKKPRDNDLEVLEFFLYQFKCRPCLFKKGTCQDKSTCEGWHHEGERRRNPGIGPNFLYSEEPCPRLKTPGTSKWSKPTNCKDGDSCVFSHTLMEQMYHPNIYKTSLCTNFTANGGDQCQWGYFCTHAHGQKDIRILNKKESIKQMPINSKQIQQQQIRNNISEITNGRPLETFVSVMPKLLQNSPVDAISNENDNMNYIEHDMQHSDNGSPSRSYHTPSYHASLPPLNGVSSPSSKYSAITPSGPLTGQSAKLPQLLLPTTTYYYQSQIPTHAVTPNTANYEQTYYNSSQTFPNRLWNERQQQYSWDINPNDVNLRPTPLAGYTHGNVGHSPMTESSFDVYSTNGRINNANSNMSPYHGSQRGIPLTTTSTITMNSPSQRPIPLSRPHSVTFPVSNSTGLNQSTHHMTPTYTIGHAPRYPSQSSTYQVYTPQTQVAGAPINVSHNVNVNVDDVWTPASQHVLNNTFNTNTLQSIPDIVSPEQSVSLQVPETPLADLNNENIGNGSTKELKNNVSYYFLGDDSLVSPLSTRTDDLKPISAPRPCTDITTQTNNEVIIAQLQARIDVLQKELESKKDKNQILQIEKLQDNIQDMNKTDMDECRVETKQKSPNAYSICPSCHFKKNLSNVLASCGHLVCKECAPQKDEHCPICIQTNQTSQN